MRLRYLEGGGVGCFNASERPTDIRRLHHQLTAGGFLLCFAATSVATLYHYRLGRQAPYALTDLPVLLGTLGGVALVTGTGGLLVAKLRRERAMRDASRFGMEAAFALLLLLTGLSGLALLAWRETASLGWLLALHLGCVLALFVLLPYSKFVHAPFRFMALVKYARERRSMRRGEVDA